MASEEELAQRLLNTIPLVMRAVGADLRREAEGGFQVSHYRVLGLLYRHPRTLSELAACQAVTLPTMSRTVSALVERGWVRRVEDPEDRRRVQVEITEEGRALFDKLRDRAQALLAARLTTLTPEEQNVVMAGLEVLEKIFAPEE